jgi:hypothetical protein
MNNKVFPFELLHVRESRCHRQSEESEAKQEARERREESVVGEHDDVQV